jgi:hypothetical protein
MFKGKGLKPPGYQAPFSCGSGGVNVHRGPHRRLGGVVLGDVVLQLEHAEGGVRGLHHERGARSSRGGLLGRAKEGTGGADGRGGGDARACGENVLWR